jgi:hypothetical protein
LFKSKSFQKQETELMFIVTAVLVKPVNRDDLPQMKGVDGLKTGSPLGLEPKGEEIQGRSGLSVTGQNNAETPAVTPKPAEPVKAAEPAGDTKSKSGTESNSSSSSSTSANIVHINQPLPPVAVAIPAAVDPQPIKP